jgi:biopolymer transport protein TolR
MSHIRSEINITPLIDIVLVLLIVFITMVPGMVKAWDVRLPSDGPGLMDHPPLKVILNAQGDLTFDGEAMRLDQLHDRVKHIWASVKPDQRKAIIKVHSTHPFRRAAELLDAVKGADPKSSVALLKSDA